jgi:hypothetical protein
MDRGPSTLLADVAYTSSPYTCMHEDTQAVFKCMEQNDAPNFR